jgi:hypothetical protein
MEQQTSPQPQSNAGFVPGHDTEIDQCIKSCLDCFESCSEASVYYLSADNQHGKALHVQLLQACAEICRTSATFMILRSPFHHQVCEICEQVCRTCAEDCDHFEDSFMKDCAQICRQCADSCRKLAVGLH